MENLTNRIANLSSAQLARLTQRLQSQPQIPLQPRDARSFPLSFAQQRLWFLHQLAPERPLHNVPAAIHISGAVNRQLLAQTLTALCARHESLRTRFTVDRSGPRQTILPPQSQTVPVIDLQQLPSAPRNLEQQRIAAEIAVAPFDLSHPLWRTVLLQLSSTEAVLCLSLHHIIADGWALGVFVRDFIALYEAYEGSRPSPLPPLPIQYVDYAVWQRQELHKQRDRLLGYWRSQLRDVPTLLPLPTDYPRPAVQSFRGATEPIKVGQALTQSLKHRAQQEGATLFMTVLAALNVLLYRYTQQTDFLIGTPVANRNRSETEKLLGVLVNTLALRTSLDGSWSWRTLLGRVREVVVEANAHQDLPFEQLIEALHLERSPSHAPLVQVMLSVQSAPLDRAQCGGLTLQLLPLHTGTTSFDLVFNLLETADGLTGWCEYSCDLFTPATIRRLVDGLHSILDSIANPNQAIAHIPLLSAAHQQQLLDWNQTRRDYPEVCFHHLFTRQARLTPEAIALVSPSQTLTYRELDGAANRWAQTLQTWGVGPDTLVGLCVERSPLAMVAILAIWKAGGAYLPLDPTYPEERLQFMLADSGATLLLTQSPWHQRFEDYPGTLLDLDTVRLEDSTKPPESPVSPDNLAYVIYTSGSTGQPKGVMLSHRGLCHLSEAQNQFDIDSSSRVLQFASLSFDASVWEMVMAWRRGAALCLGPSQGIAGAELGQLLQEHRITHATLPPSALATLPPTNLPHLNTLVVAGEACPPHLVRWSDQRQFWNAYGPTEITVCATLHRCQPDDKMAPIGRPISNTETYILDEWLQPVPIGVTGELYISGLGLARGYLNRPGLTAERFIPHPFGDSGARLYRTGDRARYRSDGTIEFLGRLDTQVKLRGFRIELEELKAKLQKHPAVQAAIAVVKDTHLVAYVVPEPGEALAPYELRAFLENRVPEYMIPAAFVSLATLPLTPNGKVDRRALPDPDPHQLRAAVATAFLPPRTAMEEALVRLWQAVLGQDVLGVEDNFFKLGGHSLLATQLVSRIEEQFEVTLPLRTLFESPTIAQLAERIQALQSRQPSPASERTITPIPHTGALPLSFAQKRLWFLHRLEPESSYHIPAAIEMRGHLDVAALEQSINAIIQRHATLRTTFPAADGQPVQVISPTGAVTIPVVDLQALTPNEQELEVQRLAHREQERPFDLAAGALLRLTLVRRQAQQSVLFVMLHHIIADGWSLGILTRELAVLYNAFSQGQPDPLPKLPLQYVDFAHWQQQWLQGEMEAQLSYWRSQLQDALPLLSLPSDRPRPPVQSFRGDVRSRSFPPTLTKALQQFSQEQNVTLFMTLLAAFKVLLFRTSGQTDLSVGTPIANRNHREIEGLIGFFVNTLVLRTYPSEELSFREFLGQVRETALGAYAHQDLPFEKLVEDLQPNRNLSYTPLFQVLFVLQNAPTAALSLPGLTLTHLPVPRQTAKFDLTLEITVTDAGIAAQIESSCDLFEGTTIERLLGHLQTLLEGIVARPDERLQTLPLLRDGERQQLLVEWNQTDRDTDELFLPQIERQVARTPERVAVRCGEAQLTYAELDRRANQLAAYLCQQGVRPEVRVGIYLERSPALLVALLAVLKAGGTYIPLDPSYPQERIASILSDAQVSVLLAQTDLLSALPKHQATVICVDRVEADRSISNSHPVIAEQLAYIIYTSGSTGKPKGVQIPHRAVANFLCAMQQHLQLKEQDVWLAVTSLSFDIAVLELFLPLTVGATVVLAPRHMVADGRLLMTQMQEAGVTVMQGTPATWRLLLAAGWSGERHLQLLCGGEALAPQLARQLRSRARCVWNLYGPTETTVWSTIHPVVEGDGAVAIGRAIANTQIYLLDSADNPVPIGVPGELCIGGKGVARGYLQRPQLTAEQFIPDPFSDQPGSRLYRTGDLARWKPDGTLEFLGRCDRQVKVRGHRLELAEIETCLQAHPRVETAVAVAAGDSLVAYIVPVAPTESAELREFLQQRLPSYAIPQQFVRLQALPLTPNGKIDRRALPAPTPLSSEDHVPPRTPTEAKIARIWQSVLTVKDMSVTANFFDLGGHSLLATQVITRVGQTFAVEVPLRQLFESPTIAELAAWVQNHANPFKLPTIEPVSRDQPLPLAFAQERLWFMEQLAPGTGDYNELSAVRLTGALNLAALHQSFRAIVQRHEILRTRFTVHQGQPVQLVASVELELPLIDLQRLAPNEQASEVERLAIAVARSPFVLTHLPLLRVLVLRLSEGEHVVFVVTHHIISDGWSKGVLIRELAHLYTAYTTSSPTLPPLPIQYADFAWWQRQQLGSEAWERQLSYWRQQLGGPLPVLSLPTDSVRSTGHVQGATVRLTLSPELTDKLTALTQASGVTLFMTLLAGFNLLLYRYTGQTDIIVGTDIANRNSVEIEGLIGFFVNLLVLRTDLAGNPSFRELLKRVQDVALQAYAHQDLPFAHLVNALQPPRQAGTTPFFQVLFVLQNAPVPSWELPNLTLTPLELDMGTAKFDLAVFLHETPTGISMAWNYRTDLFAATTINRMAHQFETLLERLVNHPDQKIEALTSSNAYASSPPQHQPVPPPRRKFQRVTPQAVQQATADLVKIAVQPSGLLMIQPQSDGVDLATWAAAQRSPLETQLLQHGAILWRGFSVPTAQKFEQVVQGLCPDLFADYGDLPRAGAGGKVYGSTPYPSDKAIRFHNESSHLAQWPMKIWFYCQQAAQQGGATPTVDGRQVYQALPWQVRKRLQQKQLLYVRNYIKGLDVSWQDFFRTRERAVVEQRSRELGMTVKWLDDDGLQTRQVRPAIAPHPQTGEWLVFNQLQLHHPAYLDPATQKSLRSLLGDRVSDTECFPRQVYYGDGSPIEPEVLAALDTAYSESERVFSWQPGDILMLDNMLVAHGRQPYVGPRQILVAMGQMMTQAKLDARS
ncbi:MAG: amino acid adenylation domain-containing protein [Cyanophyceae cyanobacterium]